MVLKGCTKRVIVIKDSASGLFDEAVFFVKPQSEGYSENDFIREANKLISNKMTNGDRVKASLPIKHKKAQKNTKRDIFFFVFGALASLAACFILM